MEKEQEYKRKLQLKLLEMIKDIDNLCRENKIDYYILYGSALGAVRHKGFIPWDDDLDIGMSYDNYKKFIDICEEKLDNNKYYVQTYEKENNYYLSFAKIRNIRTTLIEEGNKNIDIIRGVYIDVFPLTGVPNNILKEQILKINRAFMLSANINVINNKILSTIFKIILKIFGREKILNYTTKKCFKYDYNHCKYIVSITDGDGYECAKVKKSVMGKPKYVDFEDTKLPIPEDYDTYLKTVYGDYMKIPSKKQIKEREHTPYYLNLDLPYAEYIREGERK